MWRNRTIILASASPRRTQLLNQIGIEHLVMPSTCEEVIHSTVAEEVVMELSAQKAEDVFEIYCREHEKETFTVIGADTVVAVNHQILGKPKDEAEAREMICNLQGKKHQVYTGVTIISYTEQQKKKQTFYECSQVDVYPMSEEEIQTYVSTGEPMDKAGGYGIQGAFAAYIRGIDGDYNNIVGLPVARIYQEMK